jgi:hypothetical protein
MRMSPDILMYMTQNMPMKQIDVNGQGYLQRYFAGTLDDSDIWLHRFLSCDGDRHLHNHPWRGISLVLHGGYTEEFRAGDEHQISERTRNATDMPFWVIQSLINLDLHCLNHYKRRIPGNIGAGVEITPFTWHRIASVQPDTWTLMIVAKSRLPFWYFKDDAGELEVMKASPRDWHKDCKTRALTEGAVQ